MIKSKKKFLLFKVNEIWFSNEPSKLKVFLFYIYFQCKIKRRYFGYIRKSFYTKIIDLNQDIITIYQGFKQNTRNEIKKAENIEMVFNVKKDFDLFCNFYNKFAKLKNLAILDKKNIEINKNLLEITYVTIENQILKGEPLSMHLYITDYNEKRVTLLNSASLFRNEKLSDFKKIIGYANRFLHYKDMIYFKSKGFEIYDFGGYAKDTIDSEKKGINFFKDSFGGKLIEEFNYYSIPAYLGKKIKFLIDRIKSL